MGPPSDESVAREFNLAWHGGGAEIRTNNTSVCRALPRSWVVTQSAAVHTVANSGQRVTSMTYTLPWQKDGQMWGKPVSMGM
eukprot:6241427-Pyramimonas_sp.AAC.1